MREYTKWALQENIGWQEFEDICTDYLYCQEYTDIRQAGRYGDGGRDAVILYNQQEAIVFAFSMEEKPLANQSSKFYREYSKWKNKKLVKFIFVSNQDLGSKKIDLEKQHKRPPIKIFDITDLVRFLDLHKEGEKIKQKHGIASNPITFPSTDELTQQQVNALIRYSILSLRDSSHGTAKRYIADILLNGLTVKHDIIQIIKDITLELRQRKYHRNDVLKQRWQESPAHVVWLFLYPTLDDASHTNWICRTQWISPQLRPEFAPLSLQGQDIGDHLIVDWSSQYEVMAQYYHEHSLTKEYFLEQMTKILEPTKEIITQAITLTNTYNNKGIDNQVYIQKMSVLEKPLRDLYSQAGELGGVPVECNDLEQRFQSLMCFANNIGFYFSEKGLTTWTGTNRDFLVRSTLSDYNKELLRLGFELEKIV